MTSYGAVPPTGPAPGAPFQSEEAMKWPGLIGGLSIAFGIITLLSPCCGGDAIALVPYALAMAGLEVGPVPGQVTAGLAFDVLAGLALAFMLIAGGFGMLRRRPAGPRMLLRYAAVRLLLAVPMLAIGMLLVPARAATSAQFIEAAYAAQEEAGRPVTEDQEAALEAARTPTPLSYAWQAIVPLLGCAYPIVLLVWLRRPEVRATWERWEG